MPLQYKDFAPFFKSISNDYIFTANQTITASEIVFWDDTTLIGNVTVYINDAKIITQGKKPRNYPCNYKSVRGKNTGGDKVLVLKGKPIPPAIVNSIARANNISLYGYNFSINADQGLTRDLARDNDSGYNYANAYDGIPATFNTSAPSDLTRYLAKVYGWPDWVNNGATAQIKFQDVTRIDESNYQALLYGYRYDTNNSDITFSQSIISGNKAIGFDNLTGQANGTLYGKPYSGSVTLTRSPTAAIATITLNDPINIALVDVPPGGVITQDGDVLVFTYPTGVDVMGVKSNSIITLKYFANGTFTLGSESRDLYWQNNNITIDYLNFPVGGASNTADSLVHSGFRHDRPIDKNVLYTLTSPVFTPRIVSSKVVIPAGLDEDTVIQFGNYFFTNGPKPITDFSNVVLSDPDTLIASPSYTVVRYNTLSAFVNDNNNDPLPTLQINGTFNFNETLFISSDTDYRFEYNYYYGGYNNLKCVFDSPTDVNLGATNGGNIESVTDLELVALKFTDDNNIITAILYVYGSGCTLYDGTAVYKELTYTPSTLVRQHYIFVAAQFEGGSMSTGVNPSSITNYDTQQDGIVNYKDVTTTVSKNTGTYQGQYAFLFKNFY